MISKGYMRSMAFLSLTHAFLISSTRTEEEDLSREGLIPKETIKELQEKRERLDIKINSFLKEKYRNLTIEERKEAKRLNNYTVTKALELIKRRLVDMDYVVIYILKKLKSDEKVPSEIKGLIDLEELKDMTTLIEETYKGEYEKKKYVSKFEHIALINKMFMQR